jgi:hypothetical protein
MTREEALIGVELFSYDSIEVLNKKDVEELVNMIYNDFENRICKNCEFFYIDHEFNRPVSRCELGCAETLIGAGFQKVSENFGCNKFKKRIKDEDQNEFCKQ